MKIKVVEKKIRQVGRVFGETEGTKITIDPRQRSRTYLNTLIHELLHAIFPEMSETRVKKIAGIITRHLWDQNFRKVAK